MRYKISPHAPPILYQFLDDKNSPLTSHKYIEFTSDGRFFLHGKPSQDLSELGKTLVEWILFYSETNGFIRKDPVPCDCGAEKANTTHSSWCSVNKGP